MVGDVDGRRAEPEQSYMRPAGVSATASAAPTSGARNVVGSSPAQSSPSSCLPLSSRLCSSDSELASGVSDIIRPANTPTATARDELTRVTQDDLGSEP